MPISGKQTFPCPQIMRGSTERIRSPIDGTDISCPAKRRDHCKRHDVREAGGSDTSVAPAGPDTTFSDVQRHLVQEIKQAGGSID